MTYLFKLARRMASALTVAGVVVLAACSEAAPRDFLGPEPTNPPPTSGPVSLHIAPKVGAIAASQPLQFRAWGRTAAGDSIAIAASWNASGGQIGPDGVFRSAAGGSFTVQAYAIGKPHLTDAATVQVAAPASIFSGLQVGPDPAMVPMGGTLTFSAQAPLATGGMTVPSVTWTATGGTIAPNGVYSAGMAPGSFQVVASTVDGAWSDTVLVQVQAASLQSLAVLPQALTVSSGEVVDFAVAGQWNDGSTSPPAVQWESTAGSINSSGRLNAGGNPGVYRVVGKHAPSGRSDTSLVTIMPAVARIELTPSSAVLQPGAQRAFSAHAVRTDGVIVPVAVSWKATGGNISSTGVYSAGSILGGGYRVIARYLDGQFADTALVTIAAPAATLTGLTLTPGTASVASGAQVTFNAVPTWSDGTSALPALIWSATGGSITGGGIWTAPVAAGSYQVVSRHQVSGLADTATVTVTEAPRVTAVTISQQASSIQTGGTRQFSAQATWSDGASRPVEWLWSATGGTITVNGLYTAGSLAGQFLVIASCVGCSAADTTGISVTSAPPPAATLTALTLNPAQALLNPGDVLPLHIFASWNDGSNQVPDLAWTVGGGTRSGLNYTAGSTAGTFLLIARHAAGTLADTSVITIAVPGNATPSPTLSFLVLNPSSVSMNAGEQRTLTVAATWSDGTTTLPPLTWDATGGALSGLVYTAGSTAGSYRIIVRHQGGTKADTTAVTVVVPPPTLVSLQVSPSGASTPAGYSIPFTVTGKMSDSSVVTPTVTWSATGGTITSGGVYTAFTAAGTFQVTAAHAASGLSAQQAVTVTAGSTGGSGGGTAAVAELPRVYLNTTYAPPTGQVINVADGGNLQAALNSAACGDELRLAQGAVFTGNFTLPARNCPNNPIHIRTAGTLPPAGVRVSPAVAASYNFATIRTPDYQAAIKAASGAFGYRLIALRVTAAPPATFNYGLITIGSGEETTLAQMPGHVTFDRMYIYGLPSLHLKRCLAINGTHTAIVDSHLSQCTAKGQDSQAIAGWSGPGPFKIVNNHVEGAAENILFGGAGGGPAGSPSDIEIRRNHVYKPLSWMIGDPYTVKNLFELKNAVRVLVEGNVFENNWAHAQTGTAVLIMPINDGGTSARAVRVTDVTFRHNRIIASGNGIAIIGTSGYAGSGPAEQLQRFTMEHNVFEEIGRADLRSDGRMVVVFQAAKDVIINHNTFLHSQQAGARANSAIYLDANPAKHDRLEITNNVFSGGAYGLHGVGSGTGTSSLNHHANTWQFVANALTGQGAYPYGAQYYPTGNFFPSSVAALGLDANLRLGSVSGLLGKGTDGKDLGADVAAVLAATAGVMP